MYSFHFTETPTSDPISEGRNVGESIQEIIQPASSDNSDKSSSCAEENKDVPLIIQSDNPEEKSEQNSNTEIEPTRRCVKDNTNVPLEKISGVVAHPSIPLISTETGTEPTANLVEIEKLFNDTHIGKTATKRSHSPSNSKNSDCSQEDEKDQSCTLSGSDNSECSQEDEEYESDTSLSGSDAIDSSQKDITVEPETSSSHPRRKRSKKPFHRALVDSEIEIEEILAYLLFPTSWKKQMITRGELVSSGVKTVGDFARLSKEEVARFTCIDIDDAKECLKNCEDKDFLRVNVRDPKKLVFIRHAEAVHERVLRLHAAHKKNEWPTENVDTVWNYINRCLPLLEKIHKGKFYLKASGNDDVIVKEVTVPENIDVLEEAEELFDVYEEIRREYTSASGPAQPFKVFIPFLDICIPLLNEIKTERYVIEE